MSLTAPSKNVWNPLKDYKRIRWVGDRDWQDFEGNELQQIQEDERRRLFDRVFVDGAIIAETGGTISTPITGVATGNVTALSSGVYTGLSTQIYTLTVKTGGTGGVAEIGVKSDGEDNGVENSGFLFRISGTDQLDGATLYDVGTRGVKVAFRDNKAVKNLIVGDSWTLLATYSRSLPTVDAAASQITPSAICIYTGGVLLTVPSVTLTYPLLLIGKSIVYVEVIKDIVTGDADPEIKASLTGLNCAERERVRAVFQAYDPTGAPLPTGAIWRKVLPAYTWNRATNVVERATGRSMQFTLDQIPGQLPASSLADLDFSEQLRGILAELVSDITGGSYRITGLTAKLSTNIAPAGKFLVTVEKGKARISGLKIAKSQEEDLTLDVGTDTATVANEAKTFSTGTDVYALNKAIGANKLPIASVVSLSAIVEVTRNITRGGTANGLDELPDQPVQSIVSIPGYTVTTDFAQDGNFVSWAAGGIEPGSGSAYNVTYRYTKVMTLTTDYLVIDSDGDGDLDSVDFSPAGDNPVNATPFFVTYNYYQPRIDLIYLQTDGNFQVKRGTPGDTPQEPKPPSEFLGIALVSVGIAGGTAITNLDNVRITMANMRNTIRRQEISFRNDALQELFNQTQLRESAAYKGVFADAFALDNIADKSFDKPAGAGGVPGAVAFDALIDYFAFLLCLPVTVGTHVLEANNSLLPAGQNASRFHRDFITMQYLEVAEIIQEQWSEQLNVNPFAAFQPPPAWLTLVPDKDLGIDESVSVVNDLFIQNQHGLYRAGENMTADEVTRQIEIERATLQAAEGSNWQVSVRGVSREETARLVEDRGGLFMRQIYVTVNAAGFAPGEDNISARFDGKAVNLTPLGGTVAGSLGGTVKASPSTFDGLGNLLQIGGTWGASFVIPANVPTGVRTFVATGASGSVAFGTFEGNFIEREITIRITVTAVIPFDPLAQTFAFSQPTTLTRVRMPFADKPTGAGVLPTSSAAEMGAMMLELQLRGVALPGGFPDLNIYERIRRDALAIATGPQSSNDFIFTNPLLMRAGEFRALTLLSSSNEYEVYVATLGHGGQNPTQFITENPNIRGGEPPGILLQSLNALNWEAASRSALRYQIFRADFFTEGWVYFTRISGVQYSQLFLGIDQVMPESTNITWQVSVDGLALDNTSKVWREIIPLRSLDLGLIATTIDVRVKLSTVNPRVTPYINFNNWNLVGFLYKAAGTYVSVRADTLQDISTIKVYVELARPAITTTGFYASNSEDVSGNPIWEGISQIDSDVDLGDGFHDYALSLTFNNGIAQKQSYRKIRVRIDLATTGQAVTPFVRNLSATFN